MDDTGLAILITILVILFITAFGLLVWICFFRNNTKQGPAFFFKKKRDVLIKRCEQSSTYEIENVIIHRLQKDMQSEGLRLVERAWDPALDDGRLPVIVFCVISSRIGADIERAMKGVNPNDRVVLVLLHCVLSSLLRGQSLSDEEELLDHTIKNRMTGIAHFAFSDREGLYDCLENRSGFEKLLELASA